MSRFAAVVVLVLASACSAAVGDGTPSAVTTVYPLTWIVEQVAPDMAVTSLAAKGQDPHDLELTPQQRAAVEQADLVVHLGDIGFQPQVEQAIASSKVAAVGAADVVGHDALLPVDDAAHQEEEEHKEEPDHEEPTVDPHLWFDPSLLAEVAVAVGDAAAQADPPHAETYRANAATVAGELRDLAGDLGAMLSNCRHDEVVVGHEAFRYLLEPHGLVEHGISGAGGHSEASPRDITTLAAEVRDQGLPAVLSEPVEGRRDAEAVAREAGVEVIEILSLDIVDEQQAAKGYPALLREQAQAVATAAECGS